MKRSLILLLTLLLFTLTACSTAPETSFSGSEPESEIEETSSPETETAKTEDSFSQEVSAETNTDSTDPVDEVTKKSSEPITTEIAEVEPKPDEAPSSQAVNDPPPDKHEEKGSGTPEPEEEKPQEQPQAEESKPLPEPPAETKPEESKTPEPEPEKTTEPEPAPKFDIDYWIGYAQSSATSKGLVLESSAVDCWDNPITANPDCIYLERDISGYLSRYAADEDITDVWIWYECIGENKYLIYIGYA